MLAEPLPYGPDWRRMAERQIVIFLNGDIPGPAVEQEDIEKAFARASLSSDKQSEG